MGSGEDILGQFKANNQVTAGWILAATSVFSSEQQRHTFE